MDLPPSITTPQDNLYCLLTQECRGVIEALLRETVDDDTTPFEHLSPQLQINLLALIEEIFIAVNPPLALAELDP